MAEQIGLEAVFDMQRFDQGIASYIAGVKRANDVTDHTKGSFGAAFDDMGNRVLGVAQKLTGAFVAGTVAAGAAVGAFVASGVKGAMNLEAQMGAIAAVMGETKDAVGPLKELILDLGLDPSLKVNAQEAADAIEKLAANGLEMTQIMDGAAKATVLLANSTAADFDTAAAIATDTMALFNIKAEDMMTAVNGITGVTVSSKFAINDYRLALSQAGGVASATGVNFQDFNTSIAGMANYFASGSDAGTSFKTFLLRLVPSTTAAETAMGELGLTAYNSQAAIEYLATQGIEPASNLIGDLAAQVYQAFVATNKLDGSSEEAAEKFSKWAIETGIVQSAFYDANGQMKSMAEISSTLNGALAGLSEQEKSKALNTIFGTDAMRAAVGIAEQGQVAYTDQALAAKELGVSYDSLTVAMEGGLTKFEALQIKLGQTDAAEAAKVRMDNLKGSLEILQGVIDTVGLQIGFAFLPILKELADRAAELVSQYAPMIVEFFDNFAAGINTVVETGNWAAIFPTWLTTTIGLVTENMDLLTGALGGVAALLASAGFAAAFSAIAASLAAIVSPMGLLVIGAAALGAAWNTNFLGIKDATLAVIEPITNFISVVLDAGLKSTEAREAITLFPEALQGIITTITETVANVLNYIAAIQDAGIFSIEAREALTLFPEVLQGFIGGLVETVGAIVNYIATIQDAGIFSLEAKEALGLLLTSFMGLVAGVGILLQSWVGKLGEWAAAVGTTLLAVDYGAIGSQILNLIKEGWTTAVSTVMPILKAFGVELILALKSIDWKALGQSFLELIRDGWIATVSTVMPILKAFGDSVVTALKNIDWKSLGSAILTGIKDGWESAKAIALASITLIATSFKDQFGNTIQNWTEVGKGILTQISTGIASAKAATLTTIGEIALAIKNRYVTPEGFAWGTVGTDIQNAIKSGLQTAASAVGGIIEIALDIATLIKDQFTNLTWDEVGKLIIDEIKKGLTLAAKAAEGLLKAAADIGTDALNAIANLNWEEVGRKMARLVKEGFKLLAEGVGGLIPTVGEVAGKAENAFTSVDWKKIGETIISAISAGVKAIAYGAAGLIYIVAEIVKGFTKELFSISWEDQGKGIMTAIQKGVEDSTNAFLEKVKGITTSIKKVFDDFYESFEDIGRAIVDGIGAGLLAAKDSLMEKAKRLAESLPGWVQQVLGISSPSKVFMEIGRNIIEGLVMGLDRNATRVKETVQRIAGEMIPWFKLADLQFTASTDFTDRLLKDVIPGFEDSVASIQGRIKDLQAQRQAMIDELGSTAMGDRVIELMNSLRNINIEIGQLQNHRDIPILQQLNQLTFRNKETEEFNTRMEQQIALMTEAQKLGINISNVRIGDFTVEGLQAMASIEQEILEVRKRQLWIQAERIKNQRLEQEQFSYEKQILSAVENFNDKTRTQLDLMQQAVELGIDLGKVIPNNTLLIDGSYESQRLLLKLQQAIADQTGENMRNQIMNIHEEQKRVQGLESALRQLQPLIDQTNVTSAFGQRYKATVLDPILRALEQAAGIDSERVRLMNQYTEAANRLVEIRKKEEQLDFLKQQLDVVKLIADQDLVGGASLFDGIGFGINASIDDLLTLTNRVLNAMIEETKDELGIHSPSTVFAEIGNQIMAGLAQGIQNNVVRPFNSLRAAVAERGSVTSRTINLAMGGVNIYNSMDEALFESKVLRILERAV